MTSSPRRRVMLQSLFLSLLHAILLAPVAAVLAQFDTANAILGQLVPEIDRALQGVLPECYGNGTRIDKICEPGNATDHHFLFYEHKKWAYKVISEYIDQINTLAVYKVEVDESEEAGDLEIVITGSYPKEALASYIYVGECFTFDKCSILWANDDNFAQGYTIKTILTFDCQLGAFVMSNATLDIAPDLIVKEKIVGIKFDVKHMTSAVYEDLENLIVNGLEAKVVKMPTSVTLSNGTTISIPKPYGGAVISVTAMANMLAAMSPAVRQLCPATLVTTQVD